MGRISRKKRKQVNEFPMIDFSPELMEEVDEWYRNQPPVEDGKFPLVEDGSYLKTPDEILSKMRSNCPREYKAAEDVALEMIDTITDASKKFKHLSIEQSCYWMHLAAYVDFYIKYLQEQHHQQA